MTPRRTYIFDPVFSVTFLVQRGGSLQKAADAFARMVKVHPFEEEQADNVRGRFLTVEGKRAGLIWFHPDAGSGAIQHEVDHAVLWLLHELGTDHNKQTDEIFSYYAEWLNREIVRRLWKK